MGITLKMLKKCRENGIDVMIANWSEGCVKVSFMKGTKRVAKVFDLNEFEEMQDGDKVLGSLIESMLDRVMGIEL